MRVHFKPKIKLGKWSAWLIVAFAVCLGAFQANYASSTGGFPWYRDLLLALMLSPAQQLGIAAFITGLISIVRREEQSVAVRLAVVFGSFSLFGLIAWILLVTFPH
jgi:hypothetical protein